MELPYNTTISADKLKGTGQFAEAVASWATKRRWVAEAFAALESAGYSIGSAYTAVKDPSRTKFVYRDRLWQGADLVGLGVASFGHVNGVHVQNLDTWEKYAAAIGAGELPLGRAYRPTADERLIREFVLQLKRGWIQAAYFRDAYGVDVMSRFRDGISSLEAEGLLNLRTAERIELTRDGLLRVDTLLPRFFLPQHRNVRYT
jgi:oxygen-independent coproporphyrinogen-3 oxidase